MSEREALLHIGESPDADGPRLALADWLEARVDPRGEFIRLQIALPFGNYYWADGTGQVHSS